MLTKAWSKNLDKNAFTAETTQRYRGTAISKNAALTIILIFLTASFIVVVKPVTVSSATENSWETKAPMPEAIGGVKAAAVNGKICVMGGEANFEYNPDTDNWTSKKPMPTPRTSFEIAVYQNKIYAIGGSSGWTQETGTIYSDANEVYNPSTDTWEIKAPMKTMRTGLEANVVNGKIYLIGGYLRQNYTVSTTKSSLNEVYDVATDSWATKEPVPYPAYDYASAVVNNKVYIIGWNRTQIYDPESNSWSQTTPSPTAVIGAVAGATTDMRAPKRIYVISGIQGIDGSNITQVYNPENESWMLGEPMPTARGGLTVAVVNDLLYAIGGRPCGVCPALKTNEQYTPFGYGIFPQPEPEPFPTTLVALASVAIVVVAGVGLLVYFKKRKH
jgi:N-acetylneuraminic acid mutarotase